MGGGEPRYALTTTLSARVARLNPTWNQPNQDTEAGFKRAMDLVREEFLQRLDFYQHSWLPARALVEEALAQRFQVDASGKIIELAKGGCPWKEHLYHLELICPPRWPSPLSSTLTRLDSGGYSVCLRSSIHSRAGCPCQSHGGVFGMRPWTRSVGFLAASLSMPVASSVGTVPERVP